jgi:hypothetical membrane protein
VTGRRRGFDRLAASAGIVGASVIALGSVVTAAVYRGADGRPYDPFRQFVSELGELAQSRLAGVFNLSLIVGGVCFALFMSGLAASRPGHLRLLAGVVGIVAGVGGSFVGVFPMDHLAQHSLAAMMFFNLGWIAVGLASQVAIRGFRAGWRSSGWPRSWRSSPSSTSSGRIRRRAAGSRPQRSDPRSGRCRPSNG